MNQRRTTLPMLLALASLTLVGIAPAAAVSFIEDDWTRALSVAKANRRPIFVEAWAPW